MSRQTIWSNTGMDQLLPCPFCAGGKFSIYSQRGSLYAVQCHNCGAFGPTGHSRGEALALWNDQSALVAATQRADATERELAIWRTAADIAGPNTGALFAERDELRAKLAAVPVEALRRYLRYSQVPDRHHRYDAAEQRADEAAITAWLAQQSEVQP